MNTHIRNQTRVLLLGLFVTCISAGQDAPETVNGNDSNSAKAIPPLEIRRGLPPDGGPDFNRLIFEQSPYLLQHAANPVDWHSWGDDAFERARAEDKPVLLSVGYSTCHWCHVMNRESFADSAIAATINRDFIAIKVDREERPDIDHVYMEAAFAIAGSGGWPLTVFLTPERKPFFAGTYFPPEERFGLPAFPDILARISAAWREDRERVLESATRVVSVIDALAGGSPGDMPGREVLAAAFEHFHEQFDAEHGGFGGAPKFPTAHELMFLLRHWRATGEPEALAMVKTTLDAVRRGGIFDHIGYGFHRYATDRAWQVPHFEKMLHDQAMLIMAYTEAWQATQHPRYAQTVREVAGYVLRDMTHAAGGFYSAEDAESEGEEGKFYTWTHDEMLSVLGEELGTLMTIVFNAEPDGNWREEATGQRNGTNILHRTRSLAAITRDLELQEEELRLRVAEARERLFEHRTKRVHPLKDDKILSDWNGLMIAALAKAGSALGEPAYIEAADRAATRIRTAMQAPDGKLLHRLRDDEAGLPAHLDNYAFMIWGLIELYEATFDVQRLHEAVALTEIQLELFWDGEEGGFFFTAKDGEALLARQKVIYDGAVPSGNSVSALNLLRLGRMTERPEWDEKARQIMTAFSGDLQRAPAAHSMLLCALDFALGPTVEIVIAEAEDDMGLEIMLGTIRGAFVPGKVVLLREDGPSPALAPLAPFTQFQTPVDGKTTVYVCRNYACEAPTTDPAEVTRALRRADTPPESADTP